MKRKGIDERSVNIKNLRSSFNYYKRQLKRRLINEQAFLLARRGGMSIESMPEVLFKSLSFDELYNKGITRKDSKGNTIRYFGEDAIRMQIDSMRKRGSKTYQSELFVENWLKAAKKAGFSNQGIETARRMLNSVSIDKLTVLAERGFVKQIAFLYADIETENEILNDMKNAIKSGVSTEELKQYQSTRKALIPAVKQIASATGFLK